MHRLYCLLVLTLLFSAVRAQTGSGWNWAAISGSATNAPGRRVVDIASDAAGNVVATGRFMGTVTLGSFSISTSGDGTVSANYDEDAFVAKWDANGTIQWLKRYGTVALASNQVGQVITTDAAGNVFVGIGNGFPVVIKYDPAGNLLWTKTLTQFEIQGINIGPDGNPIVIASNASAKDIYKLDNATGNALWTVVTTGIGSNSTTTYKDFVDATGNIYFTAFTTSGGAVSIAGQSYSPARLTSYVASLDNNGALRWVQAIDNIQVILGYTIDQNGRSYVQFSGGFGASFQGVSTANIGGNRYVELDNSGLLVRAAGQSPFNAVIRVKDDGIYAAYLESGGTAHSTIYGSNYFFIPATPTTALGIVVKYDKADNHVLWANNLEFTGAAYNAGKLSCFDIGPGSKVQLGGAFGTAIKFGNTSLATTVAGGSNQTDFFVAQFDGSNVMPSPTTTWTGAADNNWANAANWDNGAPVGAENTVIPAGAPRYPTGITNANRTAKLTVGAGVSLSLPTDFNVPVGVVNNGTIEVTGSGVFQGFATLPAAKLTGTGRLLFTANSPATIFYDLNTNGLEVNKTGGTVQWMGGVVGEGLYLTNGVLQASNPLVLTNANAPITYSATAYLTGTLKRAVNAFGTYFFPLGNFYSYNGGPTTYSPVSLVLNSLSGPQYISVTAVGFSQAAGSVPNINLGGGNTVTSILDSKNYWNIVPDAPITTGSFDLTLQTGRYTNGVTTAARYLALNRASDNNTWNVDGTNGTATQVGGTTSGSTVSNGTVTVTASGLRSSGTYAIGIASAAVAPGTTVTTSTWTGAANNAWNNAGNWNNGIPNGLINAVIPSGLSVYPQTYVSTDNARSLQVDAGVSLKLPYNFTVNGNIVNNGTIELINGTASTFFYGFGNSTNLYAPLSGSGKLLFTAASPGIFSGTFNNSVEINRGASPLYAQSASVTGNVNIISGNVYTSYLGNASYLNLTNTAATIATAPAYPLLGTLGRAINTSGTYNFPVGDPSSSRNGPVTLATSSVTGTTLYSASYNASIFGFNKFQPSNNQPVYALDAGQWTVTPNTPATGGTLQVTIQGTGYSGGVSSASRYVLLRDSSGYWAKVSGASITENAGVITATATIPALTTQQVFIIGIEGLTTQWTGAVNSSWTTAGNWTNGVPTTSQKALLVAGSPRYPTGITISNTTGMLEIGAGVSLQLPQNFNASQGLTNNGTIEVIGASAFSGFNSGSTPLSGTGSLLFTSNSPSSISSSLATLNNGLEVNRAAGLTVTNLTINGSLVLTNGLVNGNVVLPNANASVTNTATSYINGTLKRSVTASGNFAFPVGNATYAEPVNLVLNNISGPQNITVGFTAASPGSVNTTAAGVPVTSALNYGYWTVTPNLALSGGSYAITLTESGATNTVADPSQYVVIKRPFTGGTWGFFGSNGTAAQTGTTATATAGGITGFSDFAIGIAASSVNVVLPIRLLRFSVAHEGGSAAKLTWTTTGEAGNSHFVVEHSLDGAGWQTVTTIAASLSGGTNNYSFIHANLAAGMHYYRLKQVDGSGKVDYSTTVNLLVDQLLSVQLYPNPAKGNTLNIRLGTVPVTLPLYTVTDSKGAVIISGRLAGAQTALDVSRLASGVYWVKVGAEKAVSFYR